MNPAEDAEFIETAVDWLRIDKPSPASIAAASTTLTGYVENRDWLTQVARHVARRPWCCRNGAGRCPYAAPAIGMARRVLDAVNSERKATA